MNNKPPTRIAAVLLIAALMLAALPSATWAQKHNFQAGLRFNAGLPQGDFDDAVDGNAYGLDGNFLWSPDRSPFGLGLSLGFLNFGAETRREPFSMTIPDVTVEVETSNNMFLGHLFLRTQYKQGIIRPYADALFGLNYLWMETSVKDIDSDEDIASSTDHDDAALSYGVGGGLMVRLYSGATGNKSISVLLDIGARYLLGNEAEYVRQKDIVSGEVVYDIVTTETDLLIIAIGVSGTF